MFKWRSEIVEGSDRMSVFRCIKEFEVDELDENESPTGHDFIVEKDTLWELEEEAYISDVRLEKLETYEWLEICEETLNEYFEEVTE